MPRAKKVSKVVDMVNQQNMAKEDPVLEIEQDPIDDLGKLISEQVNKAIADYDLKANQERVKRKEEAVRVKEQARELANQEKAKRREEREKLKQQTKKEEEEEREKKIQEYINRTILNKEHNELKAKISSIKQMRSSNLNF